MNGFVEETLARHCTCRQLLCGFHFLHIIANVNGHTPLLTAPVVGHARVCQVHALIHTGFPSDKVHASRCMLHPLRFLRQLSCMQMICSAVLAKNASPIFQSRCVENAHLETHTLLWWLWQAIKQFCHGSPCSASDNLTMDLLAGRQTDLPWWLWQGTDNFAVVAVAEHQTVWPRWPP